MYKLVEDTSKSFFEFFLTKKILINISLKNSTFSVKNSLPFFGRAVMWTMINGFQSFQPKEITWE